MYDVVQHCGERYGVRYGSTVCRRLIRYDIACYGKERCSTVRYSAVLCGMIREGREGKGKMDADTFKVE